MDGTLDNVIYNVKDRLVVGKEQLDKLRLLAEKADNRRARLCLHHSHEDTMQSMLIVLCSDSNFEPHRNPSGKMKFYHVVHGKMNVVFYDDAGKVTNKYELSDVNEGMLCTCFFKANAWHTVFPESETVAYYEITPGPFFQDLDNEYAQWAEEDEQIFL